MNDEERIECCHIEIRRLRNVIRLYETQRNDFFSMASNGKNEAGWKATRVQRSVSPV